MNKSTIVALIVLVVLIGTGIFEVNYFKKKYGELEDTITVAAEKCLDESLSANECYELLYDWENLRERSEIFYANIDLFELNIRITDACAFVDCGDFEQAYNQLKIAELLCQYIPNLIYPSIQHII